MRNVKIMHIAVIFTIIISVIFSQLAYAGEGVCLRVPITRDTQREKEALIEIQRYEIKEKLAKLKVIKSKKPGKITEKDKEYLVKIANHFNLQPEILSKKQDKEKISEYARALFILTSAELKSLDMVTADSFFALSVADKIDTEFFYHELSHIFSGINSLIDYSREIPKDSNVGKQVGKFVNMGELNRQELDGWAMILGNWKGFHSLDSKGIAALVDSLISYVEKIKDLQNKITKYAAEHKNEIDGNIVNHYFIEANIAQNETLNILKELKKSITSLKQNSLINIGETLQEISESHTYYKACEILFQIDPNLPYFYGNPLRLSYILTNLFHNAHDAIFEAERTNKLKEGKGKIIIKIHTTQKDNKDFIVITFSDNGVGIPEYMLQDRRLFKKGETSKEDGTGLGLYIIEQVVKEYNGFIDARNSPDGGAEFIITLPLGSGETTDRTFIGYLKQEFSDYLNNQKPMNILDIGGNPSVGHALFGIRDRSVFTSELKDLLDKNNIKSKIYCISPSVENSEHDNITLMRGLYQHLLNKPSEKGRYHIITINAPDFIRNLKEFLDALDYLLADDGVIIFRPDENSSGFKQTVNQVIKTNYSNIFTTEYLRYGGNMQDLPEGDWPLLAPLLIRRAATIQNLNKITTFITKPTDL